MLTHKKLKARALTRADVKAEYDRLDEEFASEPPSKQSVESLEKHDECAKWLRAISSLKVALTGC
jgi:hypothetical protein